MNFVYHCFVGISFINTINFSGEKWFADFRFCHGSHRYITWLKSFQFWLITWVRESYSHDGRRICSQLNTNVIVWEHTNIKHQLKLWGFSQGKSVSKKGKVGLLANKVISKVVWETCAPSKEKNNQLIEPVWWKSEDKATAFGQAQRALPPRQCMAVHLNSRQGKIYWIGQQW